MNKPDILIFMSDQHNAMFSGFAGDLNVLTPNLDKIAATGTAFDCAYTSCPFCVPARISFLTGQNIWRTAAFDNRSSIPQDQATFMHSIAAEGYETVLCGRMHFRGEDQRHGFTKRIMTDITASYVGKEDEWNNELGPYYSTTGVGRCFSVVGGGISPVLEYDRAVISTALEYLKCDHEKPQCIVVGTYGPHCPYVAPPDLYKYYRSNVGLPVTKKGKKNYTNCPMVEKKEKLIDDELILNIKAAYCGMITQLDTQVGMVKQAWDAYIERSKHQGVFVYTSDHGDCAGEHNLFGKQTFYDGSARIPLMFEGFKIKANNRIKGAVSITDIGPTLCEIVGAALPLEQDGKSLLQQISKGKDNFQRFVISEYIEKDASDRIIAGRMVRQGEWKLIKYPYYKEYDLLFNLESDPYELNNVIREYPNKAEELNRLLIKDWDFAYIDKVFKLKSENFKILKKWGQNAGVEDKERWEVTEASKMLPTIV